MGTFSDPKRSGLIFRKHFFFNGLCFLKIIPSVLPAIKSLLERHPTSGLLGFSEVNISIVKNPEGIFQARQSSRVWYISLSGTPLGLESTGTGLLLLRDPI